MLLNGLSLSIIKKITMTGNDSLLRNFYNPDHQNDGQRKRLTQPLVYTV